MALKQFINELRLEIQYVYHLVTSLAIPFIIVENKPVRGHCMHKQHSHLDQGIESIAVYRVVKCKMHIPKKLMR